MSAHYLEHKVLESDNNLALKVLNYCLTQKHRNMSLVYLILKALIILSSADMFKIL